MGYKLNDTFDSDDASTALGCFIASFTLVISLCITSALTYYTSIAIFDYIQPESMGANILALIACIITFIIMFKITVVIVYLFVALIVLIFASIIALFGD